MTAKNYALLAALIFAIIAVLQLVRAIGGWPINVGTTFSVPVWATGLPALSWRGSPGLALRHREIE